MARPRQVRKKYTKQFREEAVRLAESSARPLSEVAHQLGMDPSTLWNWVHRDRGSGEAGQSGELTVSEREELKRLRRENVELREDWEILKKATAFFAKENK